MTLSTFDQKRAMCVVGKRTPVNFFQKHPQCDGYANGCDDEAYGPRRHNRKQHNAERISDEPEQEPPPECIFKKQHIDKLHITFECSPDSRCSTYGSRLPDFFSSGETQAHREWFNDGVQIFSKGGKGERFTRVL